MSAYDTIGGYSGPSIMGSDADRPGHEYTYLWSGLPGS